ncbi:EcsC family protein [Niallia sp. 03133]|uniref:EcsC family protein n=1 Tax=Niallia sp. 03133 TaxID=3458060 RepID=UPI00404486DF
MNNYEEQVYIEVGEWKRKLFKRSTLFNRMSKKAQNKMNNFIPAKIHDVITDSIKQMITATLAGSNKLTKKNQHVNLSLMDKDQLMNKKIDIYRKTAGIEGAGTGAGGILWGLADFPLLLSIKMKFLMEAASVYGYDTDQYEERVFLLYIFQLAYSSEEKRKEIYNIVDNWEEWKSEVLELDWKELQQEYRDFIDFVKMLQLVPGIGAAVGAYANYNLIDQLGEAAKNVYRIRYFKKLSSDKIEDL